MGKNIYSLWIYIVVAITYMHIQHILAVPLSKIKRNYTGVQSKTCYESKPNPLSYCSLKYTECCVFPLQNGE